MSGRAFIDTNVLVYAVGPPSEKRQKAEALLLSLDEAVISSQIIGEFVNVCLKKHVLAEHELRAAAEDFMDVLQFFQIQEATMRRAFMIRDRYGFAWWDSLMVATALSANCPVLYTEDIQDGQTIDGDLLVQNPFR